MVLSSQLFICLLAARSFLGVFSTPTVASSGSVDVTLKTGVFRDSWLGIPYAQSPEGSLRFKAPVPITNASTGVQYAYSFGDACPQPATSSIGANISENCLNLNVWRPNGTSLDAKLPVLVWHYGGAYMIGAASDPSYNPTRIISQSVSMGKPLIFVSVNYRVNTFGFLASSDIPPEDLNAGFWDIHAALEFVQENIASFGGDPSKVTIWGQSAGAGAVEAQLLFTPTPAPFRAVIADSSTGPMKNAPYAYQYDKPGEPYYRLLEATNCTAGPTSVACLQKLPYEVLANISNAMIDNTLNQQLWQPSIGPAGSFMPERPSERILSGNFPNLPYLGGTNLNEGTLFSQSVFNLSLPSSEQTAAFDSFIEHLVIDNSTLTTSVMQGIDQYFPVNDTSYGGLYHTGDMLFDRSEAWYTDSMFLAPRRYLFEHTASRLPMYSYYFTEYIPGNPIDLGVYHASELSLLFGPVPNPVENTFANQMLSYWISFVNDLSPADDWPKYDPSAPQVMQLMRDNVTLIPDDFSLNRTEYLSTPALLNAFEK
ncbi:alpha beta-hydrolase [Coniophora puteana RWD-64-598 SS2]|uniref:Carboxylic ester hydrolase n=1 Tax=Coniophora puteana (strain RWD-64-598) TaxID=741705 RepID=A0A5M3MXS2_CONPW|nr:alpha beta-hydrolase [Coniophora puteana RWD-64-598 SS2]EIW83910.1 alpha beta-hydrolase [Coniophora puteana RWD-64-598 SS2]